MCGIAGWYRRGAGRVTRDTIVQQCNRIVHRGPDDAGEFVDGDFGFGMRRLSIIDVADGHQPITTPDGRHTIVFNGEIYNHAQLRGELSAAGVRLRTQSDTETLLAAYVAWGDAAWTRLEGMFAVAIWDRQHRTLTLARDPLGIKPLYFTQQNGGIAFASEIRALLPLPAHAFDTDDRAVHDYFMFGHVLRPRSIYRQVRNLEPGTVARIGATGELETSVFWQPKFAIDRSLSEEDWIEETRRQIERTVRLHMVSDVPVGAFLSGGVDSAAVTAAMTRISSNPIKAFTVGFPNSPLDESKAAARFAEHLGCEHILVQLDPQAARDILPSVQASFDEPCAATSAIPLWYLSRTASQSVKVVLSGEGSDEIFLGYKRQRNAFRAARYQPLFRALGSAADLLDHVPDAGSRKLAYLRQNARRFRDSAMLEGNFQRFFAGTQISSPQLRARLYDRDFLARHDSEHPFAALEDEYFSGDAWQSLDAVQQFQMGDLTVHLPSVMLPRLDRPSMAFSLEARVPFLSHVLVDWCLTMPTSMKLRGRTGKYALRKAIEPWLPEGSLPARKQGFQLPFADYFRGDLGTFAREAWHDSGASQAGILRSSAVDELVAEHREGSANHGRLLYAVAMFASWWEQSTDRMAVASDRVVAFPRPTPTPETVRPAQPPVAANDIEPVRPRVKAGARRRHMALLAALLCGWLSHEVAESFVGTAQASTFVDRAIRSHRATMIRARMQSQPDVIHYDRHEIRTATGIAMPGLPRGWKPIDVQVYPSRSGTSIALIVETERGERFSFFGEKTETASGSDPLLETEQGEQVAHWQEGRFAFAVVGSMSSHRLLQLATELDVPSQDPA